MDFGSVLHVAQKNKEISKDPVRCYSTKFEPPKKEQRSTKLSANIQKFLARKDAEEKQKLEESKKKREELLALRAQDKKATRRVNVMLKRTKSANQSVIDDAVDADNTAVTLVGPSQPDEDDYGYVSQEASAFYNKMMEKYNKMPDEPKFDLTKKKVSMNLASTKDRVRAALEREKEEAMMPHKRQRKHKETSDDPREESGNEIQQECKRQCDREEDSKLSKPKFKPKPPPPAMNFAELLKIAEKKQFEPIKIEAKPKEEERLLTKRQKKEFEREKEWRDRKEGKVPPPTSQPFKIPKAGKVPSKSETVTTNTISKENKAGSGNGSINGRLPSNMGINKPSHRSSESVNKDSEKYGTNSSMPSAKLGSRSTPLSKDLNKYKTSESSDRDRKEKDRSYTSGKPEQKSSRPSVLEGALSKNREKDVSRMPHKDIPRKSDLPNGIKTKPLSTHDKIPQHSASHHTMKSKAGQSDDSRLKCSLADRTKHPPTNTKVNVANEAKMKRFSSDNTKPRTSSTDVKPKQFPPNDIKPKQFPPNDLRPKKCPPSDVRPKQFPPSDVRPKQFPPSDVRPKQFPPRDLKPKQFPPKDVRRPKLTLGSKRRIIDDDDEDYDSEMDDFIDDGPEEEEDYSKYISEIFGYDKSRYRHVDEDVDNMESTFAQQMREEIISTKIGIMEDLEDMRQEEEDKRRKAMSKKRREK